MSGAGSPQMGHGGSVCQSMYLSIKCMIPVGVMQYSQFVVDDYQDLFCDSQKLVGQ